MQLDIEEDVATKICRINSRAFKKGKNKYFTLHPTYSLNNVVAVFMTFTVESNW
jgi:hypothetical protein